MTRRTFDEVTIRPSASVTEAMEAIQQNGIRGVFVTDESRYLLGMVMDADIRRAILKHGSLDISVRTMMKTSPIVLANTLSPGEKKQEFLASGKMLMPVVDRDNHLIDHVCIEDVVADTLARTEVNHGVFPPAHILVVGGGGYIGSPLTERLLHLGYRVRVLDLLLYNGKTLKAFDAHDDFEFIRRDCRDSKVLEEALDGVDAVVHLGEIVGDPACCVDEDFTIDTNYMATARLAEACVQRGIPRFIFASSCSVYGTSDDIVNEGSDLNPVSLYARCKIECERVIMQNSYDHFCPTVLRLATVHGLSQRQRFDLVVNLLTIKGLVEKEFQIFGGDQWRPFISVKDISLGIIRVLQAPAAKVKGEIFNIGDSRENYTINQVGEIIAKYLPETAIDRPSDVDDKRNYRVSFDKIREVLGFHCEYTIRDTVKDIIAAYEEEGRFRDYRDPKYSNLKSLK